MLAAIAFRTHDGAYLFAGILGIEVVEQIPERCKIIVPFCTVHAIMDGDETNIITRKDQFRVLSDL